MISQLTLTNFQAHKKLEISLGQITTVVGPSDVGKSSILRALRWVLMNEPRGDSFIRHQAKKAVVEVVVEGHSIVRTRGSGENSYTLDGRNLVAFGNDVPPDVAELANVTDLNCQGQHDGPFWFGLSSGEVSRQLNSVVDLSVMDDTLSAIDSIVRKSKTELAVSQELALRAEAAVSNLRWVERAQRDLVRVEESEDALSRQVDAVRKLTEFTTSIEAWQEVEEQNSQIVKEGQFLLARGKKVAALRDKISNLKNLAITIHKYAKLSELDPPDISPLQRQSEILIEVRVKIGKLKAFVTRLEEIEACLLQEREQKKMEAELTILIGPVCPLCGKRQK